MAFYGFNEEDVKKQGWLKKKPDHGIIRRWQDRWFTLKRDGQVFYFTDEYYSVCKGKFDLADMIKVEDGDEDDASFDIHLPGRIYHLRTTSRVICGYWKEAVQEVADSVKKTKQPGGIRYGGGGADESVEKLRADSEDALARLKKMMADQEKAQAMDQTPFMAARNGELDVVKEYIEQKKVKVDDICMQTMLMNAAMGNQLEVAQYLVANKAKIEQEDGSKKTAFIWACACGSLEVAQYLAEQGAAIDRICVGGDGAVMLAAGGHLDVLKWLHSKGMSMAVQNDTGATPVTNATMMRKEEMLRWLLANGCGPFDAKPQNDQPIKYAAMTGPIEIVKILAEAGGYTKKVRFIMFATPEIEEYINNLE